jgi:porin
MNKQQQYRNVLGWAWALMSSGLALSTAIAQEAAEEKSRLQSWAEQDYVLGDWGGLRSALSRHGVDFEFYYAGSLPDNLDGGLRRGGVYQGGLLMALDLDSDKLVGYKGGTFHASSLWLNGEKPFSDKFVGDLNKVNMLDFPNAARLWELWYQQKFLNGKLSLKLGELSVDRDFIVPEYYNALGNFTLLNQTFFYPTLTFDLYDVPGLPPKHHGLPSTPNTAPGAILRANLLPEFYAQAGVYGGNPDQTYSGTQFPLSEEAGALIYGEIGYRLNQQTNDTGLEGSYKVGAYYHTASFVDIYEGITSAAFAAAGFPAAEPRDLTGNYGVYFLAEQQLYRERDKEEPAKQGLVGFFRILGAPSDRNLTQFELDGGLVYKGLIPRRDWDTLALGLSYLEMSDAVRQAQQDVNAAAFSFGLPNPFPKTADYEGVIELSYKAQLTAWWTLQPSLQRVFHPGGSAAIPDATVFILQTTLRF